MSSTSVAVNGGRLERPAGEDEIFGFAKRLAKKVVSGAKAVAKKGIRWRASCCPSVGSSRWSAG